MSHFTKLKTKILDKNCLLKALQKMNYNVQEDSTIRGYNGRTRKGALVIKTNGPFDAGFIKKSETDPFELIGDWYAGHLAKELGYNRNKFTNAVQKEYSVIKVMDELKKKGFRLKSRYVTETGEIKLVVVKRGYLR